MRVQFTKAGQSKIYQGIVEKRLLEIEQLAIWPLGKQHSRKRYEPAQRSKKQRCLPCLKTRRSGTVGWRECLIE